ncbi:GDP-mannose 4,6-dehydratase [Brevundimonas sp. AAP58]|uniref:GDP-mannose 4,6-dehydratase n=1 Tax=Brevundimonas sp. AAP58 TaxID=1523422 RepID=UPI0018D1EEB0|nr:GDP-mannose 4,6-dehydratase [Brevundimonas sp. AAP58]
MTGASGFIGSHLLPQLAAAFPGRPVLSLGGPSSKSLRRVDLADQRNLTAALDGFEFDTVLHLAAESSVAGAIRAPDVVWRANALGAITLARVISDLSPEALVVHAGSAECYGESFLTGKPLDETACLKPSNPYARSKVAAELALTDILPSTARVVLLRLFNHTGRGQDERFVVPSFAAQIARAEKLERDVIEVGDLSAQRDFGHVADAAAAMVAVVAAASTLPQLSTFNVCTEVARPVEDVLNVLLAAARRPLTAKVDPARMRPSAIKVAAGSAAALRAATGWSPKRTFEETILEVLAYWRQAV